MAKNKNTNTFSDEMNKNKAVSNAAGNAKNRTEDRAKNRSASSASKSCHRDGESNYAKRYITKDKHKKLCTGGKAKAPPGHSLFFECYLWCWVNLLRKLFAKVADKFMFA